MKRLMRILMLMSVTVMLLPAMLVSCTKVKYSDGISAVNGKEMSRSSVIAFDVNWGSQAYPDNEHPGYMTVVMNRIQNATLHYIYDIHWDADGNLIADAVRGNGDAEKPEGDDQDSPDQNQGQDNVQEEEPELENPMEIYNGLYSMMAVGAHSLEDYEIPDKSIFPDSIAYRMRDLYITVPDLKETEKQEIRFLDLNPLYPTIRSVGPLYHVKSSSGTHKLVSSAAGNDNVIHLVPELMTRNISISFRIDVEAGIKIDYLLGVISGVPSQAQFISGEVSDMNTSKMPFVMHQTDPSQASGLLQFEGSVNVLGLFASSDASFRTGPGILNVLVYASAEHEGSTYSRLLHDSINLKELIENAEVMIQTEDRTGFRLRSMDPIRFDVKTSWALTLEKVISGEGQGFEIWKDNDNTDHPGLNPEI